MGIVLIILGIIVIGLVVVLTVFYAVFRSMPWDLYNPEYSFKQEYELHCHKTVHKITQDLTFNHFLNLYQINPVTLCFVSFYPSHKALSITAKEQPFQANVIKLRF